MKPSVLIARSLELPSEPREWNLVATAGTWQFADGQKSITPSDIRSCAEFFQSVHGDGADLAIDYEHATLAVQGGTLNPRDLDAAGWIHQVDARNGGTELWVRQTWTEAAQAKIAAGEKRYLSPVILFGTKHPHTGRRVRARLHSVALTNSPFFRHLPAIAASDLLAGLAPSHTEPSAFRGFALDYLASQATAVVVGSPPYPNEHACRIREIHEGDECRTKELTAGISLIICHDKEDDEWSEASVRFDADKFTPAQAQAWLREHKIDGEFHPARVKGSDMDPKELAKLLGLADDATEDAITDKIKAIVATANAAPPAVAPDVAELLGIEADADLAAVQTAVDALKATDDGALKTERVVVCNTLGLAGDASLADVQKAIATLKGSSATSEAETLVASAIKDGKVQPSDRQVWLDFAQTNMDGAKQALEHMAPIIGSATITAPDGDDATALTPEEKEAARQLNVDPDDLAALKAAQAK